MRRAGALLLLLGALVAGCGDDVTGETAPAERELGLRYGVIGDSLSNGEGVGSDRAWPVMLAERLNLDLVTNPAISGWTTLDALRAEVPALEAARPEVATVLIGANDLAARVPARVFRARLRRIYERVVKIVGRPGDVVAVTLPDFSLKPAGEAFATPASIGAFNEIIRDEARRAGIPVADVTAPSREAGSASADGLHPLEAELAAWTDVIAPIARDAWGL